MVASWAFVPYLSRAAAIDAADASSPGRANKKGQESFAMLVTRPLEPVDGTPGCTDRKLRVRRCEPRLWIVVPQMPLQRLTSR